MPGTLAGWLGAVVDLSALASAHYTAAHVDRWRHRHIRGKGTCSRLRGAQSITQPVGQPATVAAGWRQHQSTCRKLRMHRTVHGRPRCSVPALAGSGLGGVLPLRLIQAEFSYLCTTGSSVSSPRLSVSLALRSSVSLSRSIWDIKGRNAAPVSDRFGSQATGLP